MPQSLALTASAVMFMITAGLGAILAGILYSDGYTKPLFPIVAGLALIGSIIMFAYEWVENRRCKAVLSESPLSAWTCSGTKLLELRRQTERKSLLDTLVTLGLIVIAGLILMLRMSDKGPSADARHTVLITVSALSYVVLMVVLTPLIKVIYLRRLRNQEIACSISPSGILMGRQVLRWRQRGRTISRIQTSEADDGTPVLHIEQAPKRGGSKISKFWIPIPAERVDEIQRVVDDLVSEAESE